MLDWNEVGGGGGSAVGSTFVDPCPAGAAALARGRRHRRGSGPRTWGPQWTPTDPPPPPHSTQAYMDPNWWRDPLATHAPPRNISRVGPPSTFPALWNELALHLRQAWLERGRSPELPNRLWPPNWIRHYFPDRQTDAKTRVAKCPKALGTVQLGHHGITII